MSTTILFDTHRFVKHMTAAGLDQRIAEALADEQVQILEGNLATKKDLEDLKLDTKKEIELLRNEIVRVIAERNVEIVKWNVGVMFAFATIIVAVVKFL